MSDYDSPWKEAQALNTTWYEKGLEQGREQGRAEERRALLREQLEEKFGALPPGVQQRLQQLGMDRLAALSKALLRAGSLRELGLED